jgi:hypothetical protein
MQVRSVFRFYLGSLDTKVAVGSDVGGTHDIRFCSVGDQIRQFLGRDADANGDWKVQLEPYAEANLPAFEITLSRYTNVVREGECAMPAQYAGTPTAYPLWAKVVREIQPGALARDAIVLVRDDEDRYHGRVLPRESVTRTAPVFIRAHFGERDECGKTIPTRPGQHDIPDELFAF